MGEQDLIDINEMVKQVVLGLLEKMNIKGEVEIQTTSQNGRESLICNVKTEESSYLIGQYGINLQALQHLARVIVRKKTAEKSDFILDINSYRQEKNESIAFLAKNMAEKALSEKRS